MQETEDIVTPELAAFMELEKHVSAELYTPEGRAALDLLYTTIATLRAEVEGLRAVLQRILDEPRQTMSDAKALREIVRMARAAIDAAKADKDGA